MATIGTCALCEAANAEPKNSHAVSKWTCRRLIGYAPRPAPNPVQAANKFCVLTPKQVTEHLLCADCENGLRLRENYASKMGVQPDGSFPAMDSVSVVENDKGIVPPDGKALDVGQLTYFAVSVFGRADVAQIEPIVDFGNSREPIRQYLAEQTPLRAGVELFVTLFQPAPFFSRIDRIVAFPATSPGVQ